VPKFVFGAHASSDEIAKALHEAGVVAEDLSDIRRIVIDLTAGEAARIYVELFADNERLAIGLRAGLVGKGALTETNELGPDERESRRAATAKLAGELGHVTAERDGYRDALRLIAGSPPDPASIASDALDWRHS